MGRSSVISSAPVIRRAVTIFGRILISPYWCRKYEIFLLEAEGAREEARNAKRGSCSPAPTLLPGASTAMCVRQASVSTVTVL